MSVAWVFVIAGCIVLAFFGGYWLCSSRAMSDDERRRHAQAVAVNAQGRYENYKARCVYLESLVESLNRDLDRTKHELGLLDAENQDMAELLHDYVAVNACDLHKSQAYLAARVQHLKACGFTISEIQNRIFGYIGGASYYKVKRFFDGDVSLHREIVRNSKWGGGYEVHLCSCDDADWKAEQDIESDGVTVYD